MWESRRKSETWAGELLPPSDTSSGKCSALAFLLIAEWRAHHSSLITHRSSFLISGVISVFPASRDSAVQSDPDTWHSGSLSETALPSLSQQTTLHSASYLCVVLHLKNGSFYFGKRSNVHFNIRRTFQVKISNTRIPGGWTVRFRSKKRINIFKLGL